MPSRPTLLFILSLPLGAVVYSIAARVMQELFPKEPVLSLLVPLFVAGLAMMPLIIPFFDRKAKQDLDDYHRQQEASGTGTSEPIEPEEPTDASDDRDGAVASEPHEAEGTDR